MLYDDIRKLLIFRIIPPENAMHLNVKKCNGTEEIFLYWMSYIIHVVQKDLKKTTQDEIAFIQHGESI